MTINTDTQQKSFTNTEKFWGGAFLLFVIIVIFTGILLIVQWMRDDERLPLSRLVIEGELTQIHPEDVQQALATIPDLGTFMTQDINEIQSAIEPLDWVEHVSVRKQWPDLVKVFIVEYKAQAIWNGSKLLSPEGEVFRGDPEVVDEGIVNFYGPETYSKEVLAAWKNSSELLEKSGLKIQSVVLNDRKAWQMILTNGIRLELGKNIHENRLQRFVSLYEKLGDQAEKVSYIDLRYDTGAAIGWIREK